ncbi:MAG: hypothetical protein JO270_07640 [Acidobacteriaceae bacterium]|nr:hypothetical protein [Acidobacteriaceae bacterium]
MSNQQLLSVLYSSRYRTIILVIQLVTITILKFWVLKPHSHVGFLYLLPVAFAAWTQVPIWLLEILCIACAAVIEASHLLPLSIMRFAGELVGFCGFGLINREAARLYRVRAESETALRAILDASLVPTVISDEKGLIESLNRAAAELLAPPQTKLAGIPVNMFLIGFQPPQQWEPDQGLSEFRYQGRCGDGTSFAAKVSIHKYVRDKAPKLVLAISAINPENERSGTAVAEDVPASSVPGQLGELSLSDREVRVLRLVVQGLGNKEIASRLMMSESTVKNTVHQLFGKTRARSRSHLVSLTIKILEPGDRKNGDGTEECL